MGVTFSSEELAGGTTGAVPITSYAYSTGNAAFFGADATYSYDGPIFAGPVGYVTPFLVQPDPAAPTVTCSPFDVYPTGAADAQTLECPIPVSSLTPGLYTISFEQYTSTSASTDANGNTVYSQSVGDSPNTLTDFGGDVTFSIVDPTSTVSVTPVSTTSVTITSGTSEVLPTATDTVPAAYLTVTVYSTTIVSTSISYSTITGVSSIFTVTATCPPKSSSKTSSTSKSSSSSSKSSSKSSTKTSTTATSTLAKCTKNACLEGILLGGPVATIFCDLYTALPLFPPAVPACGANCLNIPAQLTSACKCLPTPTPWFKERGFVIQSFAPPDFTYDATTTQPTVTVTAAPTETDYFGPVPSTTVYDVDATASVGTSTITDPEPFTLTTTVFSSTIDARTVSTITVSPTGC